MVVRSHVTLNGGGIKVIGVSRNLFLSSFREYTSSTVLSLNNPISYTIGASAGAEVGANVGPVATGAA
jgi:hypothetical protein